MLEVESHVSPVVVLIRVVELFQVELNELTLDANITSGERFTDL